MDVDLHSTGGDAYNIVDDDEWGFAFQLGGGIAFEIAPNWAIDIGYRFKAINNLDFNLDDDVADFWNTLRIPHAALTRTTSPQHPCWITIWLLTKLVTD